MLTGFDFLTDNQVLLIERLCHLVHPFVAADSSGHDIWHGIRAARLAGQLAVQEGADPFIVSAAGIVHDMLRPREIATRQSHVGAAAIAVVEDVLRQVGLEAGAVERVSYCVRAHEWYSFRNNPSPATAEAAVFQDGDRLDALGAIGIARVFLYAGRTGGVLSVPSNAGDLADIEQGESSIDHFYTKLLRLCGSMNTRSGRDLARKRHAFMLTYLDEFNREWPDGTSRTRTEL